VYIILVNHGNYVNSVNNRISNLRIPLEQAGFNSVPGHHRSKELGRFRPLLPGLSDLKPGSYRMLLILPYWG
jgi:hypothetical protein